MKKFIKMITATVMAATMILTGSFASTQVHASNDATKYIAGANFEVALHGESNDGQEIVFALYNKNGDNIAYIYDGMTHVYTSYKQTQTTLKDIGAAEKYTVEGTWEAYFFMAGDIPCLMTNDGTIYSCEYFDAYTVSQVMLQD